jgi:hypothetical protein
MTLDGKMLGWIGESGRGPSSSTGSMGWRAHPKTSCWSLT